MGLDAYVRCRCWQDGLTSAPPVGPVGFDDEGEFDLLLPWKGNEDLHDAFEVWTAEACPHEQMELASEWISNWTGFRLFQQALEAADWERFPTLRAGWPVANGGSLSPADAAAVLRELDHFENEAEIEDKVALVDEDTGRVLMSYVAAYNGEVMLGPEYRAGVDPDGFFVRGPSGADLFRAARFGQREVPDGVEFTAGGAPVVIPMPPLGKDAGALPARLAVAIRPQAATDFASVVGALRRVCEASVATGNPVMWA